MAKEVELICTACPQGCTLTAVIENGEVIEVRGYNCKKGIDYGIAEITDPRRMVASTVKVKNGFHPLVPVYTDKPVPKPLIPKVLEEVRKVELNAPVKINTVVLENVLNTGVNVITSRDLPAKE